MPNKPSSWSWIRRSLKTVPPKPDVNTCLTCGRFSLLTPHGTSQGAAYWVPGIKQPGRRGVIQFRRMKDSFLQEEVRLRMCRVLSLTSKCLWEKETTWGNTQWNLSEWLKRPEKTSPRSCMYNAASTILNCLVFQPFPWGLATPSADWGRSSAFFAPKIHTKCSSPIHIYHTPICEMPKLRVATPQSTIRGWCGLAFRIFQRVGFLVLRNRPPHLN